MEQSIPLQIFRKKRKNLRRIPLNSAFTSLQRRRPQGFVTRFLPHVRSWRRKRVTNPYGRLRGRLRIYRSDRNITEPFASSHLRTMLLGEIRGLFTKIVTGKNRSIQFPNGTNGFFFHTNGKHSIIDMFHLAENSHRFSIQMDSAQGNFADVSNDGPLSEQIRKSSVCSRKFPFDPRVVIFI